MYTANQNNVGKKLKKHEQSLAQTSEAIAKLLNSKQKLTKNGLNYKKKKNNSTNKHNLCKIQKMQRYDFNDTDVVDLNVGGTIFCTSISTLRTIFPNLFNKEDELDEEQQTSTDEGNILSIIASGNFPIAKDKQERIFLDRNGVYFGYILDYLREGGDLKRACIPLNNQEVIEKLCIECDYFCLNRL